MADSTASRERPQTTTLQPAARKAFANPYPIPRVLPVMTIVFMKTSIYL
jgi:hypothetical protein